MELKVGDVYGTLSNRVVYKILDINKDNIEVVILKDSISKDEVGSIYIWNKKWLLEDIPVKYAQTTLWKLLNE